MKRRLRRFFLWGHRLADNQIEIGFRLATDELESGFSQATQHVTDGCGDVQAALDRLRTSMTDMYVPLQTLADRPDSRKSIEDKFAAESAQINMLKGLHTLSADQAIADQKRVENARYASLRAELDADLQCMTDEAGHREKFQQQADALEAKHNAKLRALNAQAVREAEASWKAIVAPISGAFQSSLNGIIAGNETLRQAVAKMGQSIVTQFADMAVKRATDWITSELTMTSATEAGLAARAAAQQSAALAGKAADASAGSASVFGDANKAAAGAFAATADIPIVGPVLAPVAAGAAFAAVMAYDIFSAAGGFDIPAGLNPITQLHEREMVLPASIADPLRAGLAGNSRAGAGDTHIHIHTMDAQGVRAFLLKNKDAVADAGRAAARNLHPAFA